MNIFDRKVLRTVYMALKLRIENREYRKRINKEKYQLIQKAFATAYLKSKRLEQAGHTTWRSEGEQNQKLTGKLNGKRLRVALVRDEQTGLRQDILPKSYEEHE